MVFSKHYDGFTKEDIDNDITSIAVIALYIPQSVKVVQRGG